MKKIVIGVLSLCMMLTLVACGGNSSGTQETAANDAQQATEVQAVEETTPAAEQPEETATPAAEQPEETAADVSVEDVTETNEEVSETESQEEQNGVVLETDYMTVKGLYVDDSYTTESNENTRFLYIFYSAHTDAENLKIDCKSMQITINDTNTYQAVRAKAESRYLKNYYNGGYLKSVNIGESADFVETFEVPKGELEAGRTITISKSQIPDSDKIILSTDDIVFCKNPKKVAKLADPDGFKEESWALEDASEEVVAAVQNEVNGYKWDVQVGSLAYQIEFYAPNAFELRTAISTANGNYEVKNGYVICTNQIDGVFEIPFTYENGVVDLHITDAFDPEV